jgi:hypothetical protein
MLLYEKMKTIVNIQAVWRGYCIRRDMPSIKEYILDTGDRDIQYIIQMCNIDRQREYDWIQHCRNEHNGYHCDCHDE